MSDDYKIVNTGVILRRSKGVLQSEGIWELIRRGLGFVIDRFFKQESYYLYEHVMKERNEADFIPGVNEFSLHIIRSNEEANEPAIA
ncbi:MAG: hypothetical protein MUP21_00970 [Dehalococcoidia bacterium]|nr:hypothetical protein [Dehalococcoidia bacterium]